MFRDAYRVASEFTVPVVLSQLLESGEVTCGIGAAVVVNDAGWLLTAAHMLQPLQAPDAGVRTSSYWFGRDGWAVETWEVLPEADLAVGRLAGFSPDQIGGYPVFELEEMGPGSSLC